MCFYLHILDASNAFQHVMQYSHQIKLFEMALKTLSRIRLIRICDEHVPWASASHLQPEVYA